MDIRAQSKGQAQLVQIVVSILKKYTSSALLTVINIGNDQLLVSVVGGVNACFNFMSGVRDDRVIKHVEVGALVFYIVGSEAKN